MTIRQPLVLMFIVALVAGSALPACGRIQQDRLQEDDGTVVIQMETRPSPPGPGPGTLVFSVTDGQGRPLDNATLDVEGNMTHAGMVPVFAQAVGGEGGLYKVPFEWTMGGDWIVTVKATLADGSLVTRQFNVSVGTE